MATTRVRRGKVVAIPEEWQGKTVNPKTIRQRPSKAIHKLRKTMKLGGDAYGRRGGRRFLKDREEQKSKIEIEDD